jgi:uncharacterized damage-inducible protein DinB
MKTIESAHRVPEVSAPAIDRTAAARSNCDIAHGMLTEFEAELGTTRRFLARLPADRLTWRPHEKSMTAGQLALHIAEVPAGVLELVLADEATPPDFGAIRPHPSTPGEVLDALERSAAYVRQTLPTIDDERMRQTFKVVQAECTLMSLPRADFLRSIMLNHWYHHRGQLGVYLRLIGAVVPSSYGPSGDESPFSVSA